MKQKFALVALVALLGCTNLPCLGQQLAPEEWGAPPVKVTHSAGTWTIAGKKNTVILNEKDLSFTVQAGPATWKMVPSSSRDMVVRVSDDEFNIRLADAGELGRRNALPSASGKGTAIPVPLYQLVYHDAIVTPTSGLLGFLYGGVPAISPGATDETIKSVLRASNLHAKTGLLELTNHEFLDSKYRKERTTFADGTTVTVDWDANTVEIKPDVR